MFVARRAARSAATPFFLLTFLVLTDDGVKLYITFLFTYLVEDFIEVKMKALGFILVANAVFGDCPDLLKCIQSPFLDSKLLAINTS